MSAVMTIKNKVTGVEYPVSSAEWQKFIETDRAKLFTIVGEKPVKAVQAVPLARKTFTVPPEVGEAKKKSGASEAQNDPK